MSLSNHLYALKDTFTDHNMSLRSLFEQRIDALRANIITFISNALHDETTRVLNESDATRGFVVDRILELVSDDLESEKETTITNLIRKCNALAAQCEALQLENNRLKGDNECFADTQRNIDARTEAMANLKESAREAEFKLKAQSDKMTAIADELKIKTMEFERQQTEIDDHHKEKGRLHAKLENALRTLQQKQKAFDEHSLDNAELKRLSASRQSESRQYEKQIENLRKGLMKSESERLILRKNYMALEESIAQLRQKVSSESEEMRSKEHSKKNAILLLKAKLREATTGQQSAAQLTAKLKAKLHAQSHSLSRKMDEEVGKAKALSDDVAILRKQLKSERNISKLYVEQLQKLKMEVASKSAQISDHEKQSSEAASSQKKKMHRFYKKAMHKNLTQLQSEYQQSLLLQQRQYDESLLDVKADAQQKHSEQQKATMLKMEQCEKDRAELKEMEQSFEEAQSREEGYKLESVTFQQNNAKLRDEVTLRCSEIKEIELKHSEEIATLQREVAAKQKEHSEMSEVVLALRRQKDAMQQNKIAVSAQSNQVHSDLKHGAELLTLQLTESEVRNEAIVSKLEKYRRTDKQIRQCALKYRGRLKGVSKLCHNMRLEIRTHKNELSFIKSSLAMFMERLFHEMSVSFTAIQTQSAKCIERKESGMQRELSKSISELKRCQHSRSRKAMSAQLQADLAQKQADYGHALDIDELQEEVNTIRNQLAQAKIALSPKQIKFNKISAGSIDSSVLSSVKQPTKAAAAQQRPKSSGRHESFDTATIRKLRSDLQSLESTYKHSKLQTKRRCSLGDQHSAETSSTV